MIITNDGYSIEHFVDQNKIVIGLPQTPETLNSTMGPVSNRKKELSKDELMYILMVVKYYTESPYTALNYTNE